MSRGKKLQSETEKDVRFDTIENITLERAEKRTDHARVASQIPPVDVREAVPAQPGVIELWGGVECTVNRLHDRYLSQIERSGHAARLDDIDRFADLGIRTLRYPVLWEVVCPDSPDEQEWDWCDRRLQRLQERGIRPIAGLLHHGSGPRWTSLVEPDFPGQLASFARMVAERYPWLDAYTPVNEPLTTARFSGLYGFWYPHGHEPRTSMRALLNQCRATVLAMEAIRAVNPAARLVQTEDLGKTFSTPALSYQAEFENERRWLTYDLLCGRLTRAHPMWHYLRYAGVGEEEIDWFAAHPCPPDIIGVNYYVTSERFLDEHLERYPDRLHGGNGRDRYVDVEAVRVRAEGLAGPQMLLAEAWERYRCPLAITEVHNGCTREEQLRWFVDLWSAARCGQQDGIDIRAVTAWSLLGSFDWNSMLTRCDGCYEHGVFDVRAPQPRSTALATLMRYLAHGDSYDHPVLASPGWWHRPNRLVTGHAETAPGVSWRWSMHAHAQPRPIVITGASGALGRMLGRICELRGLDYRLLSKHELDIADPVAIAAVLEQYKPWAIINAAGYSRIDDAEREPEACYRTNTTGPALLATSCAARGVKFMTFSCDYVFDGTRRRPYLEHDLPSPVNTYGRSKAEAEKRVLAVFPDALVIRTGTLFGMLDDHSFASYTLRQLIAGRQVVVPGDQVVSPTFLPDLAQACLDLLIDDAAGIWHLTNQDALSLAEFARQLAEQAGLDAGRVEAKPTGDLGFIAQRPPYRPLGSERAWLLPALPDAIQRYLRDCSLK